MRIACRLTRLVSAIKDAVGSLTYSSPDMQTDERFLCDMQTVGEAQGTLRGNLCMPLFTAHHWYVPWHAGFPLPPSREGLLPRTLGGGLARIERRFLYEKQDPACMLPLLLDMPCAELRVLLLLLPAHKRSL